MIKKNKAKILNEQFSSVFVSEPFDENLPEFEQRTSNEINDFPINITEISNLLSKLDKFKSCGNDNIHSFVLKSCATS